MQKQASQLENGDEIELEKDGTRILCQVIRAPEQVWMPRGVTTFWVRQKVGFELHMVSCPPGYLFDVQEDIRNDSTSP